MLYLISKTGALVTAGSTCVKATLRRELSAEKKKKKSNKLELNFAYVDMHTTPNPPIMSPGTLFGFHYRLKKTLDKSIPKYVLSFIEQKHW